MSYVAPESKATVFPTSPVRERRSVRRPRGFSTTTVTYAAIVVALIALFALTSAMTGLAPTLPALVGGAFLFSALLRHNPSVIVHATLWVLFMTTVPEIPHGVRIGGIFVYFYEFLIFAAVIYALSLAQSTCGLVSALHKSIAVWIAFLFGVMTLVGIGTAILRGYPFWDIQYDGKSIIELVAVFFVSVIIVAADDWRRYIKTVTLILVLSAVLTVYASATGFVLWGRTETAELLASGGRAIAGGSDAVRYITQTTPLALAALLGGIAYFLLVRRPSAQALPLLIAALVITILSFSRNTLLALAGTVIFAFIVALANGLLSRLLRRFLVSLLAVALAVQVLLSVGGALGAHDWIETQITGYSNRVIAGLDQSNEREDLSANYRDEEAEGISKIGAQHPVLGGGFGTHYKPPSGERGSFTAFEGTLYSHNTYNWLYLKIGIVGLAIFVALIAACLLPALYWRRCSALLATGAATLAGLSIAIFVAPLPIEQPGSALLGILMGLCAGSHLAKGARSSDLLTPVSRQTAVTTSSSAELIGTSYDGI